MEQFLNTHDRMLMYRIILFNIWELPDLYSVSEKVNSLKAIILMLRIIVTLYNIYQYNIY